MRLYFVGDTNASENLQKRYSTIIDTLHKAGVMVMSNIVQTHVSGFSGQEIERFSQSGEVMLDRMDCVIIEATQTSPDMGYVLALALAQKKPVLYLSERGKQVQHNVLYLKKQKDIGQFLTIAGYTAPTLIKAVMDFVGRIESGSGRETPTIKFTLRITPRIERYLQWKTHNTKLSKADYLRNLIEEMINDDDSFHRSSF